jgi:hypothetical protein
LIGVQKKYGTDYISDQTSINELFSYLTNNTNPNEKYRIGFCPSIKYPVVERKTYGNLDYTEGKWITRNLYVDQEIFRRYSDDFSTVLSYLEKESLDKLESGHYSLNNREWGDFSPKEVEFIEQLRGKTI